MSALSTKEKKQIKDLIIVLNSSYTFFKYPIGNKQLTEMVKEFESIGYIKFNDKTNKWSMKCF
jgi:hypothetical protein